MTKEQYDKEMEQLQLRCKECRKKWPWTIPIERCDACRIGRRIRQLDVESGSGWGSHKHWEGGS